MKRGGKYLPGGVVTGPMLAITGNDSGPEFILSPELVDKLMAYKYEDAILSDAFLKNIKDRPHPRYLPDHDPSKTSPIAIIGDDGRPEFADFKP